MTFSELQEYAKENGFDSVRFSFINFLGVKKTGQWLDAWLGLFRLDSLDGFITVKQAEELGFLNFDYKIEESNEDN